MPYLKQNEENSSPALYYQDCGSGKPVILIHGWPLSHRSWDAQIPALVTAGFRVIAYDRRGFGKSEGVWDQYGYDSLAADLNTLIEELQLKDVSLVGFSMGGGEVVRYLSRYGTQRVTKAALIASIIPLVPQKEDNPDGVPQEELDKIMDALEADRVGFLKQFHKNFYNYSMLAHTVSEGRLDADFIVSSSACHNATLKAAESWATTDFRPELAKVSVPTLIVHGDADKIVPIQTAGDQAAQGIPDNEYRVLQGAPHGLNVTHATQLNEILIGFLKR